MGFDAISADRFGRELVGMGGGARDIDGALSAGLNLGMGGGFSVDEFSPKARAEGRSEGRGGVGRAVGGGGTGRAFCAGSRSGLLEGLDGRLGGGSVLPWFTRLELDFMILRVALILGSGRFSFEGKGGSFAGSYAGARTRYMPSFNDASEAAL